MYWPILPAISRTRPKPEYLVWNLGNCTLCWCVLSWPHGLSLCRIGSLWRYWWLPSVTGPGSSGRWLTKFHHLKRPHKNAEISQSRSHLCREKNYYRAKSQGFQSGSLHCGFGYFSRLEGVIKRFGNNNIHDPLKGIHSNHAMGLANKAHVKRPFSNLKKEFSKRFLESAEKG